MGIEYRVSCAPEGLPKLSELLRRLGGIPSPQSPTRIEFRFRSCRPDEVPDATVVLESGGIYFVDHGGEREHVAVLFRRIVDEALTVSDSSDSIIITSL